MAESNNILMNGGGNSMRYYKQISDNYIIAIGTGYGNDEISEQEYNEIMSVIRSCPNENGKGYRLRTDLTWEDYDLPPVPPEEPSYEELLEAVEIYKGGDFDE